MTVRELFTIWRFKVDSTPLVQLEKHVGSLKETITHLGELILGEGASLFGLAESTADSAVGFRRTAEEIGTTTQKLQEMNYVAKQWDVNADAVRMSLRHLSQVSVQAINGSSEAIRVLNEAGVKSFTDSQGKLLRSDQLMDQIAKKFKTMPNDIMKVGLAMQVFGRGGTELMPMLNRMGDEFNKTAKEGRDLGFVIGEEGIENAERFKESMNRVRAVITGLRNQIGVALMPAIEGLVDKVIDWFNANREVISTQLVEFVKQLSQSVAGALGFIMELVKGISFLVGLMGGLGNVLKIVTAGFIAWTAMSTVATILEIVEVVNKLRIAFLAMGIAEAFASGGLSLILGAAAAVAAGGIAYHLMHSSPGAAPSAGATGGSTNIPTPNFSGGGGGNTYHSVFQIQTAPGTTQQQASEIAKIVDQKHKDYLRSAAVAVSTQ